MMTSESQNRSVRTLVQALLGFVLSGGVMTIWGAYVDSYSLSPFMIVSIGTVLTYLVSFAQLWAEENGYVNIPGLTPKSISSVKKDQDNN